MIYYDVTKAAAAGHRSGLTRVNTRLREALGSRAVEVTWNAKHGHFDGMPPSAIGSVDWLLTTELFSEAERPGFTSFLGRRPCRCAAIFHDAIPLKLPHITWPQSVARRPEYLKLLGRFDHVWAVSNASRVDLLGFWRWLGIEQAPTVEVIALGADFNRAPRVAGPVTAAAHRFLCVGIVEPRKNQTFLVEVCERLWQEGLSFELHLVGRTNPHFGEPIVKKIKALQRRFPRHLFFHSAASDQDLAQLYATSRATLFPTLAEGCGLPLLESLWLGVPCICSDLPVLRENSDGGGCVAIPVNEMEAWKAALRRVLVDDAYHLELVAAAKSRSLPNWQKTGEVVTETLR